MPTESAPRAIGAEEAPADGLIASKRLQGRWNLAEGYIRTGSLLMLLLLWAILSAVAGNSALFPSPWTVLQSAGDLSASGILFDDIVVSAKRITIGFLSGSALGIALGTLTGRLPMLNHSIGQILTLFRPIPSIAIVPFVIIWIGIGEVGKIAIISWAAFFPSWIATHLGVLRSNQRFERVARSCGATEWQTIISVVLPNALPMIVAGIRTSLGASFVSLYAAEIVGGPNGLGYRISASHSAYLVDRMVVGLVLLAILGALADWLFVSVTSRCTPWIFAAARD